MSSEDLLALLLPMTQVTSQTFAAVLTVPTWRHNHSTSTATSFHTIPPKSNTSIRKRLYLPWWPPIDFKDIILDFVFFSCRYESDAAKGRLNNNITKTY